MPSPLAPYACHPAQSRGRLHAEAEDPTRSAFQRDRDRIIHSAAFRRLEYKTQVFVNHEGDHYRTRLTHSLEVAQIARSLARALNLNEDLAEALALAHDLGHTPFGHAGEDGLAEAMRGFGGFDHNAQTIRIITQLEHRYAEFDGLNLTWETLEGIAKHNGPVVVPGALCLVPGEENNKAQGTRHPLPRALAAYTKRHDLELHTYPGLEAQIASLSDDIAYHNHDIDDGLRAGLFSVEDLRAVPEVYAVFDEVRGRYPGLELSRLIHEAVRRLIHRMCNDLLAESTALIARSNVQSAQEVRAAGKALIAFSPPMEDVNERLKAFLMERMYRHYKVNRMSSKARRVLKELFAFFLAEPECLPTDWRRQTDAPGTQATAEVVCDFIAGMTDRFALIEYARIFEVGE
jgi:dGTPase